MTTVWILAYLIVGYFAGQSVGERDNWNGWLWAMVVFLAWPVAALVKFGRWVGR